MITGIYNSNVIHSWNYMSGFEKEDEDHFLAMFTFHYYNTIMFPMKGCTVTARISYVLLQKYILTHTG